MLPYIAVEDKTVFAIHLRFLVLKIHLADWDSQLPGYRGNSGETMLAPGGLNTVERRHFPLCNLWGIARQEIATIAAGGIQDNFALLSRQHDLTAQSARGGFQLGGQYLGADCILTAML